MSSQAPSPSASPMVVRYNTVGICAHSRVRIRRRTPVSPVYGSTWPVLDHPDREVSGHCTREAPGRFRRAYVQCYRVRTHHEFIGQIRSSGDAGMDCVLSDPELYPFGPYLSTHEGLLLGQHQRDRVASHNSIVPLPSNVVLVAARAIPRAAIPLSASSRERPSLPTRAGSGPPDSDSAAAAGVAAGRRRR